MAIALSYALRRRSLERGPADPVNERAVAALAGAVRRMVRVAEPDPDG